MNEVERKRKRERESTGRAERKGKGEGWRKEWTEKRDCVEKGRKLEMCEEGE